MAKKNERKLKLQPEHSPRAYYSRIVPSLKLSGVWLEQSGFKAGQRVTVTIMDEELIIKTLKS